MERRPWESEVAGANPVSSTGFNEYWANGKPPVSGTGHHLRSTRRYSTGVSSIGKIFAR